MPFLLTAFGFARGFIAKLSPSQLIIAALVMLAAFQHFHAKRLEHHSANLSRALGNEKLAHAADIARWKAASATASANNKAQILHVATEQAKISRNVSNDYEAQLADLRRAYADRVRHAAPSHQCAPDGIGASPVSNAPSGVDGEAVPGVDLGYAAETELQLNALISWVRKQSEVDPNAKP
jgi:hypothetical protein